MTDQKNWKEVALARLAEKVEAVPFVVNEDGTPAANTLKTKGTMAAGILQAISHMSHEDMMKWVHDAVQMTGLQTASQNAASVKMHPSAAMKEEAKAVFGDDINEDQLVKVSTLIESLVSSRVTLAKMEAEDKLVGLFVEAMEDETAKLAEQVDQYVTYAAEQWVEKNELAIESAVKVERADRLIEGLRELMGEVGIQLPEEQVDILAQATEKNEELQKKLDEAIDDAVALTERIEELEAAEVFREVTEGMALTQVEKFKQLIESVEVGGDREELKKKLTVIRDAHFKEEKTPAKTGLNEQVDGEAPEDKDSKAAPAGKDNRYDRLADAISRAGVNRYAGFRG